MESQQKTYQFDTSCIYHQLRKPVRKQNAFHMRYVPSISKLELIEYKYIYPKAVMNASDYTEKVHNDARIVLCFHSAFPMMHDH